MSKQETRRIILQYSFGRERADVFAAEAAELLHAHWDEVAHYKDIRLNPDIPKYKALEDSGCFRSYTVRFKKTNLLIGYAIFAVNYNMHYKDSKQAVQDVLFIHKDYRGFGRKFIEWCDEKLREEGVQAVYHHVKAAHNFGPMLERMGYQLVDYIYARRLD